MNAGASKNNRKWVLDGRLKETRDPDVGWRDCKHLDSDDSLVLMSANRLISNILSLDAKPCAWLHCFGKKDHGFFVFFVFFVVMGRLPKWPRPLGTKLAITTDNP